MSGAPIQSQGARDWRRYFDQTIALWVLLPLTCWGIVTLSMWSYELDDAFIYLRYAKVWNHTGQVAYNPGQPSFGASSLPYMMLLATAVRLPEQHWPLIPKLISVLAHAALVAAALILVRRALGDRRDQARIAIPAVLVVTLMLVAPGTARWLQDGMETSLGVLAVVLALMVASRWHSRCEQAPGPFAVALAVAITAVPGVLRIDYTPISISAWALLVFSGRRGAWLTISLSAALVLGAQLGVFALTGSVLPDTAVAKSSGAFSWSWLKQMALALSSTSPMWWAMPPLLIALGVWLLKNRDSAYSSHWTRPAIAAAGLMPLAVVVLAGMARGQHIHGARYFLPQLAMIAGTVLMLARQATLRSAAWAKFIRCGVVAGLIASMIHTGALWPRQRVIFQSEWVNLPKELTRPGVKLALFDVGLIGWKTEAFIIDLAGLVNGRAISRIRDPRRRCLAEFESMGWPDYLILTSLSGQWCFGLDPACWPPQFEITLADGRRRTYRNTGRVVRRGQSMTQGSVHTVWMPADAPALERF